jgi:PleD family two-component response regulator
VKVADVEVSVTVSIGVAERLANESRDALIARADGAMYAAKHLGRNRTEAAS